MVVVVVDVVVVVVVVEVVVDVVVVVVVDVVVVDVVVVVVPIALAMSVTAASIAESYDPASPVAVQSAPAFFASAFAAALENLTSAFARQVESGGVAVPITFE